MNGNVAFMKKKNIIISTLLALAVVVIVATLLLLVSGRLVWTGGGAGTVAARPVCDSDIVNKYNDAMYMTLRDGAEEPSINEAGVKQVEEGIKKAEGYKDDATCQTLLFWIAVYDGDYESAKSAYSKIKSLHDKGVFADSNIRGNQALFSYEPLLNSMSPEAEVGTGDL